MTEITRGPATVKLHFPHRGWMVLLPSHLVTIVHALQGLDDRGQVVLYTANGNGKCSCPHRTRVTWSCSTHTDRNRKSLFLSLNTLCSCWDTPPLHRHCRCTIKWEQTHVPHINSKCFTNSVVSSFYCWVREEKITQYECINAAIIPLVYKACLINLF